MQTLNGISLFASAGIGDLALRSLGVKMLVANELIAERAELFQVNYPDTEVIQGDIWELKEQIINRTKQRLDGLELDVLIATPPCQGMSSNGLGKLLAEVRAGNRPAQDPRNRLIIPTIEIVRALKPRLVIFENVPAMSNTAIVDELGSAIRIVDFIRRELEPEYFGTAEVVEFADYGVAQKRQRLITVFSRDDSLRPLFKTQGSLIARATQPAAGVVAHKTLRESIGSFPSLDGSPGRNSSPEFHPLHRVPILDEKKYEWIRFTPEGKSAFDNQCSNPDCMSLNNRNHSAGRNSEGINRASTDTPLYCVECGSLLPRPFTVDKTGRKRIMKGFTSAYKRMLWDSPSPTLTTNLSYPSSDQNIHPSQNRVLSLFEALTVHSVTQYDFRWERKDGSPVPDSLIRDSIGESVPPAGFQKVLTTAIQYLAVKN